MGAIVVVVCETFVVVADAVVVVVAVFTFKQEFGVGPGQKYPALHGLQNVWPFSILYVPAEQLLHSAFSVSLLYVPGGHAV